MDAITFFLTDTQVCMMQLDDRSVEAGFTGLAVTGRKGGKTQFTAPFATARRLMQEFADRRSDQWDQPLAWRNSAAKAEAHLASLLKPAVTAKIHDILDGI